MDHGVDIFDRSLFCLIYLDIIYLDKVTLSISRSVARIKSQAATPSLIHDQSSTSSTWQPAGLQKISEDT